MSLRNVDFDAAFRRLADRRIEEAMKEGKFDNLPGKGQEIVIDEAPTDENARMTWWALRIMKQNDFVPDEVRWRKSLDYLRGEIYKLTSEAKLPEMVAKVNELVHKINTLGTNAINLPASPIDVETERQALRARLVQAGKKDLVHE